MAAYAVVGGVPAYLEWLDPARSLSDNIRDVILAPGSMFIAEPTFLTSVSTSAFSPPSATS